MIILFDIVIHTSASIPVIGDESITLISPPSGFHFERVKLEDYIHKSRITDSRGEILAEYRSAMHGDEIICLEQDSSCSVKHDKPANAVSFLNGSDFNELIAPIRDKIEAEVFKFFSLLHLFKEGEIARKHSFYTYSTQAGICKTTQFIDSYIEDIVTLIRYPMLIEADEVAAINDLLYNHDMAYQILRPIAIDELEYTYHTLDEATSYKNLMTPLEVMFLKNEHGEKKTMLSKRMGAFLGNTDAEMKSIYDSVKTHYHDRSEAVHEGNVSQITHTSLNELRNLVRAATKKYITVVEQEIAANPSKTFDQIKASLISTLKGVVTTKNAQNIW